MKIIGLTGGMGSGKTTIAGFFSELGIPVYIADIEAKKLTQRSKVIRRKLIQLLGKEVYYNGKLNRPYMAQQIFGKPELLQQVNEIIHPKVRAHFKRWVKRQEAPYCIKEAAILFESGGHMECDLVILVTAPKPVRIQRILQRDQTTVAAIEARMQNQWSDAKTKKMADFVIENTDLEQSRKKVNEIHNFLLKAKKS